MQFALLQPSIQEFINTHLYDDIHKLLLKYTTIEDIPAAEVIAQIEAKLKCKKKLPSWFSTPNIYYPKKINIEQTSSEATAAYKASLIEGDSIVDVTGGFGVDCFYFSKHFKKVIHCEINEALSKIVAHNYTSLGVKNIETLATNGLDFLNTSQKKFDWIYIDPSRRNDAKGKVFMLEDCLPDVISHQRFLFLHTDQILIKTSPLLDITNGLKSLTHVKEIHVVAVQNEVKELLWLLDKKHTSENIFIRTVNFEKKTTMHFDFLMHDESTALPIYTAPKKYLYEPNAAILKSGGFKSIAVKHNIDKLHQHSQLYTSDTLISFPGRRFVIKQCINYQKKEYKKVLQLKKANITTRNFSENVSTLRKKLGIQDGGSDFLFFTTQNDGKKVILKCVKVD